MFSERLGKAHALRCGMNSCTMASHLQNTLFEEPGTLKPVVPHQTGMHIRYTVEGVFGERVGGQLLF